MPANENHHQQSSSVERVYAEALLQLAEESGQLAAMAAEVEQLGEVLERSPEALKLFSSRALSTADRAESVERIFKGRVSDLLYRFLLVVNQKNRLGDLPGVVRAFAALFDAKEGVVEVGAYLANRLPDADAEAMAARIGQVIGRKVVLHQYTDPELIGGLKIRIGDEVIDGSVLAQLKILRERMIESGLERARTQAAQLA